MVSITQVADLAKSQYDINCEVIDLVSILPWDKDTICKVIFLYLSFLSKNGKSLFL